jgi:hypothetical protein
MNTNDPLANRHFDELIPMTGIVLRDGCSFPITTPYDPAFDRKQTGDSH